jgi:Zn-dependent protease
MPFFQPASIFSILVAISVHECAHAFVAHRLGDPTAKHEGRLTLNPLAHLDLFGALMFLIVGFGWAKPVPVNHSYFRRARLDGALVALAGPASNLILAFLAFVALALLSPSAVSVLPYDMLSSMVEPQTASDAFMIVLLQILTSSLFVNLALMAFNLLPIAPLDGSRVLLSVAPRRWSWDVERIMRHGPSVLLALLLAEALFHFPFLSLWVYTIVEAVMKIFSSLQLF